jgi:hypothetical protein
MHHRLDAMREGTRDIPQPIRERSWRLRALWARILRLEHRGVEIGFLPQFAHKNHIPDRAAIWANYPLPHRCTTACQLQKRYPFATPADPLSAGSVSSLAKKRYAESQSYGKRTWPRHPSPRNPTGIPTLISAIRTSYDEILKMTDTITARRDMTRLESISAAFTNLIFEPDGLRHRLRKYLDDPKSRRVAEEIRSSLNRSQELYLDALKQLKLSSSFKGRHPELLEQMTTYHRDKGRLITGIGDRIRTRGTKEELEELRRLEPLFET